MARSCEELVAMAYELIEAKAALAQRLGAHFDVSGQGRNVSFDLTNGQISLGFYFNPNDRPRYWTIVFRNDLAKRWRLSPGLAQLEFNGSYLTTAQLAEFIQLMSGMQVTIPDAGMFGLLHGTTAVALLIPQSFHGSDARLYAVEGTNLPGITGEPDPMKRLHAMWGYHERGHVVSLEPEIMSGRSQMIFCAGGGRSWVEFAHNPRPWAQAMPSRITPGVAYIECRVAPFAPVPSNATYRSPV